MPAPPEVQAATLEKFINLWSEWSPDFLSLWSDDFTFTVLPFNQGKPPRTRPDIDHKFVYLMAALRKFQLTIHNVVHDSAQGKAAIYAIIKAETPFGPYNNEQAVFISFDESGEKVNKMEELNDTAYRKDFDPKYYEYFELGPFSKKALASQAVAPPVGEVK